MDEPLILILEKIELIQKQLEQMSCHDKTSDFTVKSLAVKMSKSENEIYQMVKLGEFSGAYKCGRSIRIPEKAVNNYQQKNLVLAQRPIVQVKTHTRKKSTSKKGYVYTPGAKVVG